MGQQRGVSTSPQKHLLRISERTKLLAACVRRASGGDSRSSPSLATERLFSFLKTTVSLKKKKKKENTKIRTAQWDASRPAALTRIPATPIPLLPAGCSRGRGWMWYSGDRAPGLPFPVTFSTGCTSGCWQKRAQLGLKSLPPSLNKPSSFLGAAEI